MNRGPQARRSFLSQIGTGLTTVFGATLVGGTPVAAQSGQTPASAGRFQPVRHGEDDWLDMLPGKHRFIFDTTTPDAFGAGLLYANNFFTANQTAYKLADTDLAVVIVARHFSTPFVCNDAIWAKGRGRVFATPEGHRSAIETGAQRSTSTIQRRSRRRCPAWAIRSMGC